MTNSPAMNHKCTVHRTSSDACRSRPRSNSTCHCPDLHHGKRQRYGYVLRSAMTYAIRAATNRTIEPSPSVKNHGVPHRSQKKRIERECVARARKGSQDNYGRLTLCASLTARPMRAQRGPSTKERNMKWHMRTCEKKRGRTCGQSVSARIRGRRSGGVGPHPGPLLYLYKTQEGKKNQSRTNA